MPKAHSATQGTRSKASSHTGAIETTRHRILHEAARLFGVHGYFGTSTRDIARASGIQQPTLYWHFPTKRAIMAELLEADITDAINALKVLNQSGASAGARLYRFLHLDTTQLSTSPYNLVAVYDTAVLDEPEFSDVMSAAARITRGVRSVLREGMATGQFVEMGLVTARELVLTVDMQAGRLGKSMSRTEQRRVPHDFSSFVLRGLLEDPTTLDLVRREAMAIQVQPLSSR